MRCNDYDKRLLLGVKLGCASCSYSSLVRAFQPLSLCTRLWLDCTMQWRPLILLFCGIAVIYLASLLQETPYPHPLKVYTSDTTRWRHAPDETILTTAGDYLYLTAIRYNVEPAGFKGLRHGTGDLKTGVVGNYIYPYMIIIIHSIHAYLSKAILLRFVGLSVIW